MKKDFLTVLDLTAIEVRSLFELTTALKSGTARPALDGKIIAMLFEKASLRTRVTFEVGMVQLGGHAVYLAPQGVQLGVRESVADVAHNPADIGASLASGSFVTMGMAVIPCSIKTLSAIANSYDADLVARAADVTLKEGRPLVLVVRETPLHLGHLRLMARAAETGAVIMPPTLAFYSRPQTVDQIVNETVGRVLLRLGLDNDLYFRWLGLKGEARD